MSAPADGGLPAVWNMAGSEFRKDGFQQRTGARETLGAQGGEIGGGGERWLFQTEAGLTQHGDQIIPPLVKNPGKQVVRVSARRL